jgi:hypothetical protein
MQTFRCSTSGHSKWGAAQTDAALAWMLWMYACIEQGRPAGMAGIALDVAYRRERSLATSDPSASPVLSRVSGVRHLDQTQGECRREHSRAATLRHGFAHQPWLVLTVSFMNEVFTKCGGRHVQTRSTADRRVQVI